MQTISHNAGGFADALFTLIVVCAYGVAIQVAVLAAVVTAPFWLLPSQVFATRHHGFWSASPYLPLRGRWMCYLVCVVLAMGPVAIVTVLVVGPLMGMAVTANIPPRR